MTSDLWLAQRAALQKIAASAGLPAIGERGSLQDALACAELLMLAPHDAAVLDLFRNHREQALSFLNVAHDMDEVIETSHGESAVPSLSAPYHEFAELVIDLMAEVQNEDPDAFDQP